MGPASMESECDRSPRNGMPTGIPNQNPQKAKQTAPRPSNNLKQPMLKQLNLRKNESLLTECMLCSEVYELPSSMEQFLSHLLSSHHLVIADTHCIADMRGYVDYWRTRLLSTTLPNICTTMHAPVKQKSAAVHAEPETKEFFLLSDILPEDCLLRQGLQKKRLEWVLQQQQLEREDDKYTRGCLFCRSVLTGTRSQFLDHLSQEHNLQLGRPHNLVFIDELVDFIEQHFERLQCLYCEKYFKDRLVLREHMRKKMHKRINPSNHVFDQYYIVNYLEMGKDWTQVQSEVEEPETSGYTSGSEAADGDVADWEDWNDDSGVHILCLFCDVKCGMWEEMLRHLQDRHKFSFSDIVSQLDFYQKVKLVNFIRHQMENTLCIVCEEKTSTREELLEHMSQADHFVLPDQKFWDRPEYYFPTYEDDGFLCQLDDARADGDGTPECVSGEEPDPQLCQALTDAHISEVIEFRASLTGSPALMPADAGTSVVTQKGVNNPHKTTNRVSFKD